VKDGSSAVLLDTQALVIISGAGDGSLSKPVHKLLADPETERLISAASIMEIAIKSAKLNITEEQARQAAKDLALTIIPFTPQHAYRLFTLPKHHKDPFDRMIIATALVERIPLVGADRMFKRYKGLKVIW
jgi:PIN domain nuclease of toxin-antitoxin system